MLLGFVKKAEQQQKRLKVPDGQSIPHLGPQQAVPILRDFAARCVASRRLAGAGTRAAGLCGLGPAPRDCAAGFVCGSVLGCMEGECLQLHALPPARPLGQHLRWCGPGQLSATPAAMPLCGHTLPPGSHVWAPANALRLVCACVRVLAVRRWQKVVQGMNQEVTQQFARHGGGRDVLQVCEGSACVHPALQIKRTRCCLSPVANPFPLVFLWALFVGRGGVLNGLELQCCRVRRGASARARGIGKWTAAANVLAVGFGVPVFTQAQNSLDKGAPAGGWVGRALSY